MLQGHSSQCPLSLVDNLSASKEQFICPCHRIVQIYRVQFMENGWWGPWSWIRKANVQRSCFLYPLYLQYKYFIFIKYKYYTHNISIQTEHVVSEHECMGYSPYLKDKNILLSNWLYRIDVLKVNGILKINPHLFKTSVYLQTRLLNTVEKMEKK